MTRQVTFACNIARPKARDTPRSGHPAPTCLPCQPSRFHLPAPHQANPPSAQHSAREQERAETARQGSLTVTFTARKSPVQATSCARQPIHQPSVIFFQSSFHLRPTPSVSCGPQTTILRTSKKPALWAVSFTGLLGQECCIPRLDPTSGSRN
jgi:hypothetical protein